VQDGHALRSQAVSAFAQGGGELFTTGHRLILI